MNVSTPLRPMPGRPRGAVLYVALIMLILLGLLGIAGAHVAGMQEKMASNYHVGHAAFQNAEGLSRRSERMLEAIANRSELPSDTPFLVAEIQHDCTLAFDSVAWARTHVDSLHEAVNVRRIDACILGDSSLAMGGPLDPVSLVYQITAVATDSVINPSSSVSIDSIFRL